jgi:hypothetical protein
MRVVAYAAVLRFVIWTGPRIEGILLFDPIHKFMYALKSSEGRRQYPKRLKMLFDYLKLSGPIEEQARVSR